MSALSTSRFGDLVRATRPVLLNPQRAATSRRVLLLMAAIVLMGVADLLCTLAYMRTIGLPEANPIARWLAQFGSTQAVVCFKLLTMAMSCLCLYKGRTERRMEWCAWACAGILLALSLHWISFNRAIVEHTNLIAVLADHNQNPYRIKTAGRGPDNWVRLEE